MNVMNIYNAVKAKFRLTVAIVLVTLLGFSIGGTAYAASSAAAGIRDPERISFYQSFKGKSVVFVPVFMHLDLTEGWSRMMELQSKATGYKYQVRNANFQTSNGTRILTQLIHSAHKPNIIVVQNPDVTSYARLEEQAEKAGIFVIQLNMKSLATTSGFVGGDATRIGEIQARAIVKHCGANTNTSHQILILNGPTTAPWTVYMQVGYRKVLSKHPEIKVVSRQSTGNYVSAKAKQITEVVLQQHPKLCGIMGVWDNTDVGTVAAVKAAGKQGQVFVSTSGGGGVLACQLINSGDVQQYVSYDVPDQARDVTDLIAIILQDQSRGLTPTTAHLRMALYTPLRVLTKASVKIHPCWSVKTLRYGIVDLPGLEVK